MPPDLPPSVQLEWIVSGGGVDTTDLGTTNRGLTNGRDGPVAFGEICDAYLADQTQKQETTLAGERIHLKHLKRILRRRTPLQQVELATIRNYKERRKREQHRGRCPSEGTIKKELVTFRQVWMWAKHNELVSGDCPLVTESGRWKIHFEKPAEREKFRTWAEIQRRIQRGGITEEQVRDLWSGLYLDQSQVSELLTYVERTARYPFIHPMFAFAAYTGARKSEVLRSQIDDFQFDTNQVLIRERKRKKDKRESVRLVPLHPKLRQIMESARRRYHVRTHLPTQQGVSCTQTESGSDNRAKRTSGGGYCRQPTRPGGRATNQTGAK